MFETFPKDYETTKDWQWSQFESYVQDLQERDLSEDSIHEWLADWSTMGRMIWEMYSRNEVATSVDTTDKQAEKRYEHFMQNIYPAWQKANHAFNQKLIDSGIEPQNFETALRNIRAQVALFREENLALETEENLLSKEYDKITGAQTVIWDGEEKTLQQLLPIYLDQDRSKREKAFRLEKDRVLQDRQALNDLWVKLIKIRRQIAANADCKDYREYQWRAKQRFDYTSDDAQTFFDAIEQVVVPAAERIYAKKQKALGVDSLRPWDTNVDTSGKDPLHPFDSVETLKSITESIFNHVSPELGQYVHTMRQENLLDLDNRKGKAPGGYCTSFAIENRPFIFMNAVGIHDDVQTMLHEAGHAFHVFESADIPYIHQTLVPIEFAEVASMSMELLAAPYLAKDTGGFYSEEDAARARIQHLEGLIQFWPYMAVVSSFQHWAYTHPEGDDTDACDAKWKELFMRFMRGIDFDGLEDWVETGWHRKLHIFHIPFYYIEYGLAQLGAVQVWANSLKNQADALASYRKALSLGSLVTLPELFETAGAKFAFDPGTLDDAVTLVENTIQKLEAV